MNKNFIPKFLFLPTAVLLALAPFISTIHPVLAQSRISNCQAPDQGEYLLLVVSPTEESQKQLRKALPEQFKSTTCSYLGQTVTRVGGFKSIDDANRWARFVNSAVGLSAIITTRPKEQTTANSSPPPIAAAPQTTVPTKNTTSPPRTELPASNVRYNPRNLGEGYAVLVDYFNRPELVGNVQKVVGGDVGLVSYGQRPYLLAVYTTNQKEAYNTLQRLNENGFFALLADGRKVVLLRSVVSTR
jgi:hypothetical protein